MNTLNDLSFLRILPVGEEREPSSDEISSDVIIERLKPHQTDLTSNPKDDRGRPIRACRLFHGVTREGLKYWLDELQRKETAMSGDRVSKLFAVTRCKRNVSMERIRTELIARYGRRSDLDYGAKFLTIVLSGSLIVTSGHVRPRRNDQSSEIFGQHFAAVFGPGMVAMEYEIALPPGATAHGDDDTAYQDGLAEIRTGSECTELLHVPYDIFEYVAYRRPDLWRNLAGVLVKKSHLYHRNLRRMSDLSDRIKLFCLCLRLARNFSDFKGADGEDLDLPVALLNGDLQAMMVIVPLAVTGSELLAMCQLMDIYRGVDRVMDDMVRVDKKSGKIEPRRGTKKKGCFVAVRLDDSQSPIVEIDLGLCLWRAKNHVSEDVQRSYNELLGLATTSAGECTDLNAKNATFLAVLEHSMLHPTEWGADSPLWGRFSQFMERYRDVKSYRTAPKPDVKGEVKLDQFRQIRNGWITAWESVVRGEAVNASFRKK